MSCPSCGTQMGGGVFCPQCGAAAQGPAGAVPMAGAPPPQMVPPQMVMGQQHVDNSAFGMLQAVKGAAVYPTGGTCAACCGGALTVGVVPVKSKTVILTFVVEKPGEPANLVAGENGGPVLATLHMQARTMHDPSGALLCSIVESPQNIAQLIGFQQSFTVLNGNGQPEWVVMGQNKFTVWHASEVHTAIQALDAYKAKKHADKGKGKDKKDKTKKPFGKMQQNMITFPASAPAHARGMLLGAHWLLQTKMHNEIDTSPFSSRSSSFDGADGDKSSHSIHSDKHSGGA